MLFWAPFFVWLRSGHARFLGGAETPLPLRVATWDLVPHSPPRHVGCYRGLLLLAEGAVSNAGLPGDRCQSPNRSNEVLRLFLLWRQLAQLHRGVLSWQFMPWAGLREQHREQGTANGPVAYSFVADLQGSVPLYEVHSRYILTTWSVKNGSREVWDS